MTKLAYRRWLSGVGCIVGVSCSTSRAPLPVLSPVPEALEDISFRAKVPLPQEEPSFEIPVLQSEVWENGLRFTQIVRPLQRNPVLVLLFASLSSSDLVDRVVIEGFAQRVIDALPSGSIVRTFEAAGGLGLVLDLLPDDLDKGLSILADALTKPVSNKQMSRARKKLMRARSRASRSELVDTILHRERYGAGHPWGKDAIQQVRALAELKSKELVAATRERLWPGATYLVYSGSLGVWSRQDTRRFRSWSSNTYSKPERVVIPAARRKGDLRFHLFRTTSDRSSLYVMHVGPGVLDSDYGAFSALCLLLGGILSEAGREFRVEGGSSYGVHTSLVGRREATECQWYGTFKPGELARAVEQHMAQLDGLRRGEIDGRSLAVARGRVTSRGLRLFADPAHMAKWVATQRALGRSTTDIVQRWRFVPDLSDEALRRVAESTFHPPHLDFVAVYGALRDYYALSARGADIHYRVDTTDE